MNWEDIAGNWTSFRGRMHERWRRLSDSDLEAIRAGRERAVRALQERYGISAEQADAQLLEWQRDMDQDEPTLVLWRRWPGQSSQ